MAITIQSATRVNAAPCQHWRIVINGDGVNHTVTLTLDQVEGMLDDLLINWKGMLALAWMRYQREVNGLTIAQMVGQAVVE
jgi:hypothetical protein